MAKAAQENNSPNISSPTGGGQEGASYFQQRMNLLGITDADNKIGIWHVKPELINTKNAEGIFTGYEKEIKPVPVFRPSDKGIEILVYSLDRDIVNFKPENSRWSKHYCLTRLEKPVVKSDGSIQKYHIPKGAGTYPFFHPSLIEKFEKQETIDTLFLTEGFFKAWKGCMHGLPVVGLSSITHLKEKDTGLLHIDIRRLRDICGVKRMVWLTDGDCLDITTKDLTDGVDLFKRPKNFYSSCENFKNVLDDWDGEKWFFHINSDDLVSNSLFSPAAGQKINRPDVKGLDDLMITFPDRIPEIIADAKTVATNNKWFVKHNITTGTRKIYSYFHLLNVNDFYLFHKERRPEIEKLEFVFNGTRYKFEDKENECKVMIPGDAKLYFRVGDNYYKFIDRVNEEGDIEMGFEKRLKSTIVDDQGPKFCKHIPKYEVFTNKPGHTNYEPVIHNNFNLYQPLPHDASDDKCEEDDCPYIINFLKHIFGEKQVSIKQTDGSIIKTAYYQVAVDYIQILYQYPVQRLPILCPVSKENETGKSTLGNLLKGIFGGNAVTVGNSDLADDFNSFWASKLLIMCDETKIDKMVVVERVKALTFQKRIGLHAKGKDKTEIPFFGKFILFSNNEDSFIFANEDDLRYWVVKVPKLVKKDPDYEKKMLDEIPDFLSFLNHRKIVCPRVNRMWFDEDILRTDALKKVILKSHSTVKKELKHHIANMFLDFGVDKIEMSLQDIHDTFFRNKESNYIQNVLKDEMGMLPFHRFKVDDFEFDTNEEAVAFAQGKYGAINDFDATRFIKRLFKIKRYSYPRLEHKVDFTTQKKETVVVWVSSLGRPYVFKRNDFIDPNEESDVPQEVTDGNPPAPINGNAYQPVATADDSQGDLPF